MVKKPASYDVNQAGIAERYYTMNGQATMTYAPFTLSHDYPHTEKWASTLLYLRSKGGANVSFNIDGGKTSNQRVNPSPELQVVKMDGITSHAPSR